MFQELDVELLAHISLHQLIPIFFLKISKMHSLANLC